MMSMQIRCFFALFFVAFGSGGYAQDAGADSLPFNPVAGETVVFLGDSITHQCLYTQYLENFFITRYPEKRIGFHNAGVSGDKAGDCLARFDDDVVPFAPDYVLVLLGMNDGQYEDFNGETFELYRENMIRLLDRIDELGARAIVLSPTMFDHGTAARRSEDETWRFRSRAFSENYNALLAYFGAWCLEESARRTVPFVNLWGPLNEHTIAQRRTNPDFTMIDDAIHPQASGQMVMAFEILSQLGVEKSRASSIVVSKRGKRWIGKDVHDLSFDEESGSLSFRHTAPSLPWVIPERESSVPTKWELPSDGRIGYELTRAGHKLSADRLKVVGLPPGTYEVLIDDMVIGKWSHAALGTKIEIQEKEATPQFQQALEVALLNRKRNDEWVRPLRDKWSRIKGKRRKQEDGLDVLIEEANSMARSASEELDAVYEAATPRERHWTIRPVQ